MHILFALDDHSQERKLVCHFNLNLTNLDYEVVRRVERPLEFLYGSL